MSSKPRVIATLLARDEQDIVLNCIEHHLKHGVDGFVMTNNLSKDNTAEIMRNHPACLHFINEKGTNHSQETWVTRMSKIAFGLGADWILNTDADEFWYGMDKLGDLPKEVNAIKVFKRYDHILNCSLGWGPFSRTSTPYCRNPLSLKVNRGKTIYRAHPNVRIEFGNHVAHGPWGKKGVITDAELPDIFFHHYLYRSYKRWCIKCRNAGALMHDLPRQKSNNGSHVSHWNKAWYAHLDKKTLPEYRKKVYDEATVAEGVASGKFQYFVPDDELPIAELGQRSGFVAGCGASGSPKACSKEAQGSSCKHAAVPCAGKRKDPNGHRCC